MTRTTLDEVAQGESTAAQLILMQNDLRLSVFDGISQQDVKEIVEVLVAKAKKGDLQAMRFVLEYIVGTRNHPFMAIQNNVHVQPPVPPPQPVPNQQDSSDRRVCTRESWSSRPRS